MPPVPLRNGVQESGELAPPPPLGSFGGMPELSGVLEPAGRRSDQSVVGDAAPTGPGEVPVGPHPRNGAADRCVGDAEVADQPDQSGAGQLVLTADAEQEADQRNDGDVFSHVRTDCHAPSVR